MQLWLTPMIMDADGPFLFIRLPSVFDIGPRSGLTSGGATDQIRVDEITNISSWTCSFDGLEVQATIISSRELNCVTPPSELDLVSVKLLLKEHDLEVDTGFTFQYHDKLEIRSIFPESAPTVGDTMINISISGLRQDS
jgi:hypothetical protein